MFTVFSQGCALFAATFDCLKAYLGSDDAPWKAEVRER